MASAFRQWLSKLDRDRQSQAATWRKIRSAFPAAWLDRWAEAVRQIASDGVPVEVLLGYVRSGPEIAKILGGDAALAMSSTIASVAGRAGATAAMALLANAPRAAALLRHEDEFCHWLDSLNELAQRAPMQVRPVCDRVETLLSQVDAAGFHAWMSTGLSSTMDDTVRQSAYFSLADFSSIDVLEQEASDTRLDDLERRLKAMTTGLWRVSPLIRPAAAKKALQVPRRTSFEGSFVRCPATFAGFRAKEAESLFKAAIAHIGAHLAYTTEKFAVGSLKPVQVTLISILEDSRVERLAGLQYPGLLRLWRSLHTARADGPALAGPLLARLARALIDPDYCDDNPWIAKALEMFEAAGPYWDAPQRIRHIGVLLGNDLGQMRVQFNPKTYLVQPPYRDDNLGIWDLGELPQETADDPDVVHGSVRIEQTEDTDRPHHRQRQDESREAASKAGQLRLVEEEAGIPVARYAEWDYRSGRERADWVTVMEYRPISAPSEIVAHILSQYGDIQRRIAALISQVKVGRPVRVRRRPEGDRLDIDACIRTRIDQRAGSFLDARVYESSVLAHRDLSVLVLLDISESTKDTVKGTATSVYSIERAATALLAEAMSGVGDPFAIHAFCSNGRQDLRYFHVKDFGSPYDDASRGRLVGLKPGLSTRMGAALRHAGREIAGQNSHRRLILIVTDGEPSDIDVTDGRYLVEDARKAVHDLARQGIDVFCVGLDGGGDVYLSRIFGRRNAIQIDNVERLPERLPMLYLRLAA